MGRWSQARYKGSTPCATVWACLRMREAAGTERYLDMSVVALCATPTTLIDASTSTGAHIVTRNSQLRLPLPR